MFEKSIRIQLYDEKEGMVSDRMVKQLPEFYAGPKDIHQGPLRIEFTIETRDDATMASDYLRQLVGILPLKAAGEKTRGRKSSELNNDDIFDNDKERIIIDLLTSYQGFEDGQKNQDQFISELRAMGYIFVETGFLNHIIPETYKIKLLHKDYQWLIKRTKEAKDPKNDKFDPQILIGIKIMHERSSRTLLYTFGEYKGKFNITVPEKKPMKVGKTNLIKFPSYMNEEERFKWGAEHRILYNNPEKTASKFYMRWIKDVVVGDELKIDPRRFNA